jgi:hypothetical protein
MPSGNFRKNYLLFQMILAEERGAQGFFYFITPGIDCALKTKPKGWGLLE